jgi:hypothetical protein
MGTLEGKTTLCYSSCTGVGNNGVPVMFIAAPVREKEPGALLLKISFYTHQLETYVIAQTSVTESIQHHKLVNSTLINSTLSK